MNPFMSDRPLNIAHRGARSLAPENTLAAARAGYEHGADMWELDVAVTADNELVLLHDATLERTSNALEVFPERAPWEIQNFTLAELRRLDFGSWYNQKDPFGQIEAGAVSAEMQRSYHGEPVATLREALEFTRDHHWTVDVEIKDASGLPGDKFVVEKVVGLIDELGMAGQVMISSFNHGYLTRVKAANPNIVTAALVGWPVGSQVEDAVDLVHGLGAEGYNPPVGLVAPESIAEMRKAGVEVYVWTVNDADTMRDLVASHVTGIITDFPQWLKKILAEIIER